MQGQLKRNLPNEHGGWVLFCIGIVVGVACNPGRWQLLAALAWSGLFLLRVPVTRIADAKGSRTSWTLAGMSTLAAGAGLFLLAPRPNAVLWALPALLPGAILIGMRKRSFIRSAAGEVVSALAVTPIAPSMACAGGAPLTAEQALLTWSAMAVYMLGSVARVRSLASASRHRTVRAAVWAGLLLYAATIALLGVWELWPWPLVLGALPAFALGGILIWHARGRRLNMMRVGLWETAAIMPFAAMLVFVVQST